MHNGILIVRLLKNRIEMRLANREIFKRKVFLKSYHLPNSKDGVKMSSKRKKLSYFIEFHTCFNKKNYQGVSKDGKLICWTCWEKQGIQNKNLLHFKKPLLRPRIITLCKNCGKKSRVSRTTKLCFICDTLSCIF